MPAFETTGPIAASIELSVGAVQVSASERADAVIEVRPTDPASEADQRAAAEVDVDFADGRLRVTGPRPPRGNWGWAWTWLGLARPGSVDISVGLPAGSAFEGRGDMARFRCAGPLADCRIKTAAGDIDISAASASCQLDTSFGDIAIGRAGGHTRAITGSGRIQIREIEGTAEIKSSNGDISIGAISGDLLARSGNGSIEVLRAGSGVDAKTACGSVRIGEVSRGSVVMETAAGELEIGIREGTAAWLDASSVTGRVRNGLTDATEPGPETDVVEIRARTAIGDIVVRRA